MLSYRPLAGFEAGTQTGSYDHDRADRTEQTMRAVVASRWGATDVLEEAELPRPTPGPTEIVVAVHAAGVNPVDWKSRASGGFGMWQDPPVIGWDVSGVVEQVGGGSSLYRVGDEVFGMPRFPRQAGAYAEYVVAPSHKGCAYVQKRRKSRACE